MPGIKLNQDVDIALRAKVIPDYGPKERQPPDMMALAEGFYLAGCQ